jgi:hypothetical protein
LVRVRKGVGVVDGDLARDAEGTLLLQVQVGGEAGEEVGYDVEHGDAVEEAVDGRRRVDDGDGGVERGEGI